MRTHTGKTIEIRQLRSLFNKYFLGERPYKCQYCDRSYAQSNDLLKHTRIHVGENTYKCNLCNNAFRLQAQLRDHYRIHYDANNVLRTIDSPDQKPTQSEIEMMVNFAPEFSELIKDEKADGESLNNAGKLMYPDLPSELPTKKQKIDH